MPDQVGSTEAPLCGTILSLLDRARWRSPRLPSAIFMKSVCAKGPAGPYFQKELSLWWIMFCVHLMGTQGAQTSGLVSVISVYVCEGVSGGD